MTGESLWSSHPFHFFSSPTIIPTSNIIPSSSFHHSSSLLLFATRKSLPFLGSTSRNCSMYVKGKQRSMVVKKEVNGEEERSEEDIDDGFEEQGVMGGDGDGDESDQNGYKKKRLLSGGGRRVSVGGGGGGGLRCCQAENCSADLSDSKPYHRRHKVCEYHAKAQVAVVGGIRQRFCQQCSRFHELAEFDETKRSCRRRLAGHNERRRKNSAESHAEGSGRKGMGAHLKDMVCGQVDDRGRIKITIQDHAAYKHFQIR